MSAVLCYLNTFVLLLFLAVSSDPSSRRFLTNDEMPEVTAQSSSRGLADDHISNVLQVRNLGNSQTIQRNDIGLQCEGYSTLGTIRSVSMISSSLFINVYMPSIPLGNSRELTVSCQLFLLDDPQTYATFTFTYWQETSFQYTSFSYEEHGICREIELPCHLEDILSSTIPNLSKFSEGSCLSRNAQYISSDLNENNPPAYSAECQSDIGFAEYQMSYFTLPEADSNSDVIGWLGLDNGCCKSEGCDLLFQESGVDSAEHCQRRCENFGTHCGYVIVDNSCSVYSSSCECSREAYDCETNNSGHLFQIIREADVCSATSEAFYDDSQSGGGLPVWSIILSNFVVLTIFSLCFYFFGHNLFHKQSTTSSVHSPDVELKGGKNIPKRSLTISLHNVTETTIE